MEKGMLNEPIKRKSGLLHTLETLNNINSGLLELNDRIESFAEIRVGSIRSPEKGEEPKEPNCQMEKILVELDKIHRNLEKAHKMIGELESAL